MKTSTKEFKLEKQLAFYLHSCFRCLVGTQKREIKYGEEVLNAANGHMSRER